MKKDMVIKVKNILEKYEIQFDTEIEFKRWIKKLTDVQYENLLNLDIDRTEIEFDTKLLIDTNLLLCKDYQTRVLAMSKIKCPKEYIHLMSVLVSEDFLQNQNYYLNMIILAKAKHLKFCLWLILSKNYENNKHHIDDLDFVAKAKESINAQVLSEVALNKSSQQSKYHRRDMEILLECSKENLLPTCTYPSCCANHLAINKVSLTDPFHLENMKILASQKIGKEYLYLLMTDKENIKSKNYRREISRLQKAKTLSKARAIYYYIANPKRTCVTDYFDGMMDQELKIDYTKLNRENCIKGESNQRYNFYLKLLNEVDDKYVMYISYLLSNKNLLNSGYLDEDIKFILKITNKKIFVDLFNVIQNENSLNSIHHKNDIYVISRIENNQTRKMLVKIATNKYNLNSIYHQYDMMFISSLNLDELDEEIIDQLIYYVLDKNGINSQEHINKLEELYQLIKSKEKETKLTLH